MTQLKKEVMSWEMFDDAVYQIADNYPQEPDSQYNFDFIFAIPRGGLVMGVKLSYLLEIPIYSNTYEMPKEISRILLVDDVSDTGKTLQKMVNVFKQDDVTVATLYKKPWTIFNPDFHVHETDKWIVYPWDK